MEFGIKVILLKNFTHLLQLLCYNSLRVSYVDFKNEIFRNFIQIWVLPICLEDKWKDIETSSFTFPSKSLAKLKNASIITV